MEQIKVTISKAGEIAYEVSGVKGAGCKALTKAIDELAGGQIIEQKNNAEFCQVPEIRQTQKGKG